tara:strand:+ start:412 stop:1038 length:627 start_codon:yes stop_codon:yes gene_type:complete
MDHKNICAALAAFHKSVGTIDKTARAQYGNFADLSTVLSAITPALSDNGLALVQSFELQDGDDVLLSTLYHTSGESIQSRARLVRVEGAGGRQNPLHLWGGSVTYQRRYAALALVGLAAGMEDDDGDIADPPKKQAAAKRKKAEKAEKVEPPAEPWDSCAHADQALGNCKTADDLARWIAKTKASGFIGVDRDSLLESYSERRALVGA